MIRHRFGVALAVALSGCSPRQALPFYRTAQMSPEWLTAREASARSMHHVASFAMLDQNGSQVSERAFAGKATIVSFFFTKCGDICPMTTEHIQQLLGRMPNEARVQVLSYSVAPERDSLSELRWFADQHGISDARWHLLTGTREATERLARESYFTRLANGVNYGGARVGHTESVLLVDAQGRLRGVYAGTLRIEMQKLEEDLVVLLAETAEEGVTARMRGTG
jgi:protein SCO1/2